MGGYLNGTGGTVPQKIEVGAHAFVPSIFGEVVLLKEACESSKRKKGVKEKLF